MVVPAAEAVVATGKVVLLSASENDGAATACPLLGVLTAAGAFSSIGSSSSPIAEPASSNIDALSP